MLALLLLALGCGPTRIWVEQSHCLDDSWQMSVWTWGAADGVGLAGPGVATSQFVREPSVLAPDDCLVEVDPTPWVEEGDPVETWTVDEVDGLCANPPPVSAIDWAEPVNRVEIWRQAWVNCTMVDEQRQF